MPSLIHVHKYQRLNSKRWRCNDPHCTHTIPKEEVIGKASMCICGHEFVLTRELMRRRTPKCLNCSNTKKAQQHRRAQALISTIFKEAQDGDIVDSET